MVWSRRGQSFSPVSQKNPGHKKRDQNGTWARMTGVRKKEKWEGGGNLLTRPWGNRGN